MILGDKRILRARLKMGLSPNVDPFFYPISLTLSNFTPILAKPILCTKNKKIHLISMCYITGDRIFVEHHGDWSKYS